MMITCAVWPGRLAMKLRAKRRESSWIGFFALAFISGPRPPYISGLLTSQEVASMTGSISDELTSTALAADADHEAPIVKVVRGLNPRPAGHNSTAWIADCARRSHSIMISPSHNEFGCGYCKRAGDPAELQAFCEGIDDRNSTA